MIFNGGVGSFLLNMIWIATTGWELAVEATVIGIFFCITIVGIPFGKQYFKIARLALTPFGAETVNINTGGIHYETMFRVRNIQS